MKKQLLLSFIALLFGTSFAFSQTTLMCGEMFTDAEGPNSNYANNANVTTTICPNLPTEIAVVNFNSFSLENNMDFLSVYDGPSANYPLIGTYTGTTIPQQIAASGSIQGGCLTFVFTSNDTVTSSGWTANIDCFANPLCPQPMGLNVTFDGASTILNWTSTNNMPTTWQIQISPSTIPNPILTSNTYYVFDNLSPGNYVATVSALCNGMIGQGYSFPFTVAPPVCQMPNNLAGLPLSNNSYSLSWIESGSATSWEVLALPCGTTPTPNNIGTIVTTAIHTFNNIIPNTCYNFYVRSICDATTTSNWSSITYQPETICPPITSMEASTLGSTAAVFQWTNSSNASSWEVVALPCNTSPNTNTVGTTVTTPSYTFTNLFPNTCYSLYVRAICSTTSISTWSTATNITTPANPNPNPTCGGTFTDPGGASANYGNSSNVTTTICPSNPGELVTITFTSFALESNFDFLKIYDGESTAGALLANLSGTNLPSSYTSSSASGCLTFVFTSDNSVNLAGWVANITCSPVATCSKPTNATISSLLSTSLNLTWNQPQNPNGTTPTQWEVYAVPCGSPAPTSTTSGIVASTNSFTYTGLTPSTCYCFYVRALCSANESSEWSLSSCATTIAAPPACGGTFVDNGGATANYANSSDNTYTICPTNPGEIVTVTFTSFDTEVNYDGLYVFNGNSITSPQIASANLAANVPGGLAGSFWGTTIPGPFTSSDPSGCLTFRFRSDASVNRSGWQANITCNQPTSCATPSVLTLSNISVTSAILGWANNSNSTSFEVVALPCGTTPNATTTGTTTTTNSYTFNNLSSATCYSFYVRALCSSNEISNWSPAINGTTLIAPPVCGGTFTDNGGLNANYANSSDNTYTICPTTSGEVVTVTFTSFDTEVNWDGLYVFDGNSINAPQIASTNPAANVPGGLSGAFWGTTIPGPFTSTDPSGCLTFRFRSDTTINRAGWNANVTCGLAPDKITLIAFVDANNNGIKDTGESMFSNGSFVYQLNDSGTNTYATSTTGLYSLSDDTPTNSYDFSYEILSEYSPYYSSGTTVHNNITIPVGSGNTILYFPITVTQTYNDVSVTIIPLSAPRPGLSYTNRIVYKNLGIAATSGTITFVKPTLVTISTISQTGTVANTTGFTYAYTNLLPNETRIINVTMAIPASPTVNLNNVLTDSATITSTTSTDINPNNNSTTNSQIVVNSYDPNDKMESRGDKIPFNQFTQDDYLYYTIRFQNEGTANAIDIKIEDVLSSLIDAESIRMVGSSHNCVMRKDVNSHNVIWEFNNIQLVPSSANADLSKGYVMFKVKLNPGFTVGTIVSNTANIYFDSNPAIITNTFNTKFTAALSNVSFDSDNFVVYPNPANTFVQVKLQNNSENIDSISLTDLLGKTIKTMNSISSNNTTLDISDVAKGVYMIEITTDSKLKQIKKLVIE